MRHASSKQLCLWLIWLLMLGGEAAGVRLPKLAYTAGPGRAPLLQAVQQQMRSWSQGLWIRGSASGSSSSSSSSRALCASSSTQAAAVISEPAQRRVAFAVPAAADGAYTLHLRGDQSCGAGGASVRTYVWAIMALPDKQLVFNSTGPVSSVRLKPGSFMVGLLVMDGLSNHAMAVKNVTIPRVRLRDRLAGRGG